MWLIAGALWLGSGVAEIWNHHYGSVLMDFTFAIMSLYIAMILHYYK